ncbi:unnamed protein product [Linum trigynum]|uniref:Uncharacterized protein n=1 Tax=Linum trigynum TaxID=586398 RepID=A0AAV2FPW0_9ROSI
MIAKKKPRVRRELANTAVGAYTERNHGLHTSKSRGSRFNVLLEEESTKPIVDQIKKGETSTRDSQPGSRARKTAAKHLWKEKAVGK